MKKVFLAMAALFQLSTAFAQDKSGLLTHYYEVKDALVSGNSNAAATAATALITAAGNSTDKAVQASKDKLVADAQQIASGKDLAQQREQFKQLSADMYTLAKTTKLSEQPVYQQYCPMKKASWLSSSNAIKNPYFGSQMLTCGKVADTIQ
ncbi:DUF3347 domain-containing protein [Chitinophaga sp. Cy-1792]|uniref:DUF3347 domain-containing protein n=1 Tax=Chitinophaga sp. Cy-1792 TaxID=2608339 RepID=UPI00141DE86B|nr:DUF3347 domain-containing protein [Chitinophaga sp. Cy-1792]NIG53883.1 DUF3347 domain-containing protein [Chitinophaga sp. Cy-1792]